MQERVAQLLAGCLGRVFERFTERPTCPVAAVWTSAAERRQSVAPGVSRG